MERPLVRRIFVLNVPIDFIDPDDLETVILEFLENGESNQIIFLDLKTLLKARRNEEQLAALKNAALVLPLTKDIANGAKFLYKEKPTRYMPFDFIIQLLGILEAKRKSVYLLGSRGKSLKPAEQNLRASFPDLLFVGRHVGFFKKEAQQSIVEAIRKAAPALLLCGSGLKGGSRWLYAHNQEFNPGITLHYKDCYEIFSRKRRKPSRKTFEKGLPDLNIFRNFAYNCLLLMARVRGR